ncbi:transient receptor potential domain containing protein [Apiospora aurea]|uniref:Transient receptor potential domain containing protein n=1 Tax=Apiospora aurea TaxID=335848 RepID=A0ABR1QAW5_9PEZI
MARSGLGWNIRRAAIWATAMAVGVVGDQILTANDFSNCKTSSDIVVTKSNMQYNNDAKKVTFDVLGTSNKRQNVTAVLKVTAYGQEVYANSFNPCEAKTYVEQLCPVPSGTFGAKGSQDIPSQYTDMIPSIAFQIPDIAAMATLQLKALDGGQDVGCIQSQVTNGKTAHNSAVSLVAAGVAGAALVLSGVSAAGAAFSGAGAASSGAGGAGTVSPSFTEVFGVFQGFAMNGMMSVNVPQVYRSFSKNFAFSTGLIPWTRMQMSIDNFRNSTGGNLTMDGVQFLKNATLVFPDGSTNTPKGSLIKRSMQDFALAIRDIETIANPTQTANETAATTTESSIRSAVSGISGYVQMLSVPKSNTFMTVLLIVAIVIGVIVVGILLVKVVLEFWALFGSFPESLTGFRKHYWGSIARAVTSLIMLLYGIWVLYCIFQFTHGDSWAAKVLAGVTLALFTAILAFFSYKIWSTAKKLKDTQGDSAGLYDDKDIWVKYSLFYESYRKDYWWIFVPTIIYMFAKGCCLAATDGHGMVQTIVQLIIEGCMFIVLLWSRPYERKSSNWVNIAIQTVRVLSVVCILVFVEEFGIQQTTQTVTGVVLIALQSALTGILAILVAWNAIVACCKENPHRKRRKELEKMQRETDALTPLDARNSLLLDRKQSHGSTTFSVTDNVQEKQPLARNTSPDRYLGTEPANPYGNAAQFNSSARPLTPNTPMHGDDERLIGGAAPMGREPTLPNMGVGGGYGGGYGGNAGYGNNGYAPYRY